RDFHRPSASNTSRAPPLAPHGGSTARTGRRRRRSSRRGAKWGSSSASRRRRPKRGSSLAGTNLRGVSGETWHIELERSEGFAGITFNADADSSKLDPQAAADLQRLAGAVDFSRPRDGGAGVPDAFHYHIVAEHGSERHE